MVAGEGETREIRSRLEKGNTDTGNIKANMFENHLNLIKVKGTRGPFVPKFCRALALARALARESWVMHDNEFPDELSKLIKGFAQYWRTSILKKDDWALGIAPPPSSSSSSSADGGGVSSSRAAFYRLFETLAPQIESIDYEGKTKFNVKLGHSRNPKSKNAQNKAKGEGSEEPAPKKQRASSCEQQGSSSSHPVSIESS